MDEINLLKGLFDKKILSILDILVNDKSEEGLYLREISKKSKVSPASTYRILKKLMEMNIIKQTKIKQLKLYKADKTKQTEFLYKLLKKDIRIINLFVDMAKEIDNIQAIILHGQEQADRANVLLIGEGINSAKIKEICGSLQTKHRFTISPLVLAAEQYEQMIKMGLYSGKEKVIWKR
jgi:DNA-binding transcriptional ArsR family regulator